MDIWNLEADLEKNKTALEIEGVQATQPESALKLTATDNDVAHEPNANLQPPDEKEIEKQFSASAAPRQKKQVHPVAIKWLEKHRQQLLANEWTAPELYRRNKSKGICFCTTVWNKTDVNISIQKNGSIAFKYLNETGRYITQTAYSERSRNRKT